MDFSRKEKFKDSNTSNLKKTFSIKQSLKITNTRLKNSFVFIIYLQLVYNKTYIGYIIENIDSFRVHICILIELDLVDIESPSHIYGENEYFGLSLHLLIYQINYKFSVFEEKANFSFTNLMLKFDRRFDLIQNFFYAKPAKPKLGNSIG